MFCANQLDTRPAKQSRDRLRWIAPLRINRSRGRGEHVCCFRRLDIRQKSRVRPTEVSILLPHEAPLAVLFQNLQPRAVENLREHLLEKRRTEMQVRQVRRDGSPFTGATLFGKLFE